MADRNIKAKVIIIGLFVSVGLGVFITRTEPAKAANDDIPTELSNYKSWGRMTKEPFKVNSIGLVTVDPPKILGTFQIDGAFG